MSAAVHARLPVVRPPLPVAVGSVFAADAVDAATGFLVADTGLRGGLRLFPLFTPQPIPGWRSTATSSLAVVAGWRHRSPDAVAVRLGGRGRLAVLEAEDADALARLEGRFGPMPTETVQSRSTRGCHRFWMRLDRDDLRTIYDLVPGVTIYSGGAWMKLPPAGAWVAGLQPGRADFEPCPAGLLPEVADADQAPTIRRF